MLRTSIVRIFLGRWTRTTQEMNNIKVDWANIDHCGTCSAHTIKNTESEDLSKQSRGHGYESVEERGRRHEQPHIPRRH